MATVTESSTGVSFPEQQTFWCGGTVAPRRQFIKAVRGVERLMAAPPAPLTLQEEWHADLRGSGAAHQEDRVCQYQGEEEGVQQCQARRRWWGASPLVCTWHQAPEVNAHSPCGPDQL